MRKRIARIARAQDRTPHGFIREAILEKLEAEEAQAAFRTVAMRRLERMRRSGVGVRAEDVFKYLEGRAEAAPAKRPKPRKMT
jgi:predicted transcriptional regulator